MNDDFYPPGPANVRADLTRPSAAYRRHAYLAVVGVVLFLVGYVALASWFAWTSVRLFMGISGANRGAIIVAGGAVAAAFLALLMFKAMFFIRRGELERDIEVTAKSHPRLFAFLYRLADEARAPRPHRVFVSPRVNAAVSYDLSIVNLIFSSKKNLEIGLGLVNALTLSELKAVLAHEFGHFAQRTMAVSRWVYIAQVIAQHLVAKRDGIDRLLHRISNMDPRVAWVGWGLRLIVWSIRSVIESVFGWVIIAKRALSREMELNADLVAVSLTGSDALIHALYRLEAADDALDQSLAFADEERVAGKAIADLFAVQNEMIARMRGVLADELYGLVPPLPTDAKDAAAHRLFKAQFAQPPRMWSTHPANNVREENAKSEYVPALLDDRSAWVLFEEPRQLRTEMTSWVYARAAKKAAPGQRPKLDTLPIDATLARLAKKFDRCFFDAAYRGVYLGRSCVRAAQHASDMYGLPLASVGTTELDALYPATISADLERMRELMREHLMLSALERGILETPGKLVRYRDRDHHRRALPQLIEQVNQDLQAARAKLSEHDKLVRTTLVAAARQLSPAWEAYLKAVGALLHYAEHREADLADAMGALNNSVAIALADGRVSAREAGDLVAKARVVHAAIVAVHREVSEVQLGSLARPLEVDSWKTMLGPLSLPAPTLQNIGSWIEAAPSWVGAACRALDKLATATLDELLRVEREVAGRVANPNAPVAPLPEAPRVPQFYATLVTGAERPRQTKLGWWERFHVADGFVPGAARFLCAGGIIAIIIIAAHWVGNATVHVINGLNREVIVVIDDQVISVEPRSDADVDVHPLAQVSVRARTKEGEIIESFDAGAIEQYADYAYNVAQAAPLVEYTPATQKRDRVGVERWREMVTNRVFDADENTDVRTTDRPFLIGPAKLDPEAMLELAGADAPVVALAHMRWDAPTSTNFETWFGPAQSDPSFPALLAERIAALPDDVMLRRYEQEQGPHDEVCARHRKRAAEAPDSPGWQYLAARCIEDPAAVNDSFSTLATKWPDDPWIMYAHAGALADREQFEEAMRLLAKSLWRLPGARSAQARLAARIAQASGKPVSRMLLDQDPLLARLFDTDNGDADLQGDRAVFHHLRLGNLASALAAAEHDARISVLVACSDGATPKQVEYGAVIGPDKIPTDVAIYAYALALRTGHDGAPFRMLVDTIDDRQALDFVDQVHEAPPGELAKIAPPVDLQARGVAYAAATVLLGNATPSAWRDAAKRTLFVIERPYLK
jgi:Zn-dependent protease with chaperone function/tellurite resistance protein